MLWVKALHIVFVTSWFAGLFYLPRIYVNLALVGSGQAQQNERARLLTMARKLLRFMLPLAVLAIGFGVWLWIGFGIGRASLWMHLKLAIVLLLMGYHAYCAHLLTQFELGKNRRGHLWYRWFNEIPVVLLVVAVVLVVVKPF